MVPTKYCLVPGVSAVNSRVYTHVQRTGISSTSGRYTGDKLGRRGKTYFNPYLF